MERRALTILELLIAIVLVASLTALVVPAVLGRVGDFSLDAAARQVEAAFIAARAQAQREGLPVAVMARPEAGGGVGVFIEAMEAPEEPSEDGFAPAEPLVAAWTVLPSRVELTDSAGEGDLGEFSPAQDGEAGELQGDDGTDRDETAPPLLVAVVLPDGTASLEGERYLEGPGGERLRLRVNRWTGAARFERVVREEGLLSEEDESPEGDFGVEAPAVGEGIGSEGWEK